MPNENLSAPVSLGSAAAPHSGQQLAHDTAGLSSAFSGQRRRAVRAGDARLDEHLQQTRLEHTGVGPVPGGGQRTPGWRYSPLHEERPHRGSNAAACQPMEAVDHIMRKKINETIFWLIPTLQVRKIIHRNYLAVFYFGSLNLLEFANIIRLQTFVHIRWAICTMSSRKYPDVTIFINIHYRIIMRIVGFFI